jgi:hypothetical protein
LARPTGAVRDALGRNFGLKADAVLAAVRTGDNVFVKTEHRVMFSRVQDFTTAPGKERLGQSASSKTIRVGAEAGQKFLFESAVTH